MPRSIILIICPPPSVCALSTVSSLYIPFASSLAMYLCEHSCMLSGHFHCSGLASVFSLLTAFSSTTTTAEANNGRVGAHFVQNSTKLCASINTLARIVCSESRPRSIISFHCPFVIICTFLVGPSLVFAFLCPIQIEQTHLSWTFRIGQDRRLWPLKSVRAMTRTCL